MIRMMPTCREVTELVTDYLEGRMSLWERLRFQIHILMCRHCREYLRQINLTVDGLRHLPPDPIAPEIETEILQHFRSFKRDGLRGGE